MSRRRSSCEESAHDPLDHVLCIALPMPHAWTRSTREPYREPRDDRRYEIPRSGRVGARRYATERCFCGADQSAPISPRPIASWMKVAGSGTDSTQAVTNGTYEKLSVCTNGEVLVSRKWIVPDCVSDSANESPCVSRVHARAGVAGQGDEGVGDAAIAVADIEQHARDFVPGVRRVA